MYVESAVQSFSDRGSIPLRSTTTSKYTHCGRCVFDNDKSTGNVTLHPMLRQCSAKEQTLFPHKGCVFVPDKSAMAWIYAHFFKVCVFALIRSTHNMALCPLPRRSLTENQALFPRTAANLRPFSKRPITATLRGANKYKEYLTYGVFTGNSRKTLGEVVSE